jgi:hypothetical protein
MAKIAIREPTAVAPSIGTMREGHVHASLKARYLQPGDEVEAAVDGYVVDILRGDLIIEVQTGNFSSIARKVRKLVESHTVRLVHPVARELWIVKQNDDGTVSRRKSPLRRDVIDVFAELVSFPELIAHENFELDVVLTQEEERRVFDGRSWRRRGWARVERRLLDVIDTVSLRSAADYLALLPVALPAEFLTSDIAAAFGRPRRLAQQMAYCLKGCGLIEERGRRGNAIMYRRAVLPSPGLTAT